MNRGIEAMEELERKSDNSQLSKITSLSKRRRNTLATVVDPIENMYGKKMKLETESGFAIPSNIIPSKKYKEEGQLPN